MMEVHAVGSKLKSSLLPLSNRGKISTKSNSLHPSLSFFLSAFATTTTENRELQANELTLLPAGLFDDLENISWM